MVDTKKNTSNIQENERSGLRISHKEDTKITSHIDVIDLENVFKKRINGIIAILKNIEKHQTKPAVAMLQALFE
ncbi:BfmA/BtgA family mobilization protein [Formosa sp. L2A11]|uniref:BfmA/BtgA family mobilization protein n=1 Tax=Formosa sp. L2A11 TaxID=2686363 RepID=UPI00131DD7F6|nr:BfmA/BtgA family mobilization protein [Formosa sp. L2A11]